MERRSEALTSTSKIVNNVPTWVSSRHLRRSNHKRLAYQSSTSGAVSEIRTGPNDTADEQEEQRECHGVRPFPKRWCGQLRNRVLAPDTLFQPDRSLPRWREHGTVNDKAVWADLTGIAGVSELRGRRSL